MILTQKIKILSKLGKIIASIADEKEWKGFDLGINETEYNDLRDLVNRVKIYNGWFTPSAVKIAFKGIANWLTEKKLSTWTEQYQLNEHANKSVAIIMAGNIPLVGFHDFLAVFLSGNKTVVKLSSDDKHLFPALLHILSLFNPDIKNEVVIKEFKLDGFDAVIATGSDNSANYFQTYFGKYPHIIRQNRTSIAVLRGDESKETLESLGEDIFTFYGLGCRNLSQVWIPKDFDINRLFDAFFKFSEIANHNKYANNYDYNKAVYLMNLESLLDNGFLLLKEDKGLTSPLGMLHYVRYEDKNQVETFLSDNKNKIQAVVGEDYIPFGTAQCPQLNDYADGIDTLKFLSEL